tara:strand:+ start:198 stop:416 length:219 start_codon:yes stop_codon:yes gene_type:complete
LPLAEDRKLINESIKIRIMKKLFLCLFLVGSLATTFTSCREEKSTGDKIEDAADDVGDSMEDAADDVKDAVD